MTIKKTDKILITGGSGMVGTNLAEELRKQGYEDLISLSSNDGDLREKEIAVEILEKHQPDIVFHLAARVGGIKGNRTYPADFLEDNIYINTNIMHAAHRVGVKKLINFGSICIYPKLAPTPVKEEYLLTGPLEESNKGYAIAKIAGVLLAQKYAEQYNELFVSVMPENIFGINDNFHTQNAHVIPMLLERFHEAKQNNSDKVTVWGTGKPTRGFIYSRDVATGLIKIMEDYHQPSEHINLTTGVETSISELAETIKQVVGFEGELEYDTSKPDGTPKRYLDNSKMKNLGWQPQYTLREGLEEMYEWFKNNQENLRRV